MTTVFIKSSNLLGRLLKRFRHAVASRLSGGISSIHTYNTYEEYISQQKEKTTDSERIVRLLGEEWEMHLNRFRDTFRRNYDYIKDKKKALCLGSRTGQEVKVLWDMGIDAIGIDLVPFEPYTVEGDIHDLEFHNNEFDLVFTNILDHALYPEQLCSEMERVAAPGGVIIMHLQLGSMVDTYAETVVYSPRKVAAMFRRVELKESRRICVLNDPMDWELVMVKN